MTILSAASQLAQRAVTPPLAIKDRRVADATDEELIAELNARAGERPGLLRTLAEEWSDDADDADDPQPAEIDYPPALLDAADWWQRGDKREALHYLEIALGNDFHGLENLKPEDLK